MFQSICGPLHHDVLSNNPRIGKRNDTRSKNTLQTRRSGSKAAQSRSSRSMCQTEASKISYAANLTWSKVVQFLQTCSVTGRSRLEICRVPTSSFQKELHTSTDRTIICFKQTCNCEHVTIDGRIRSASANRRPPWPCHCQHFCSPHSPVSNPLFPFSAHLACPSNAF
jgi:hypothetical protein